MAKPKPDDKEQSDSFIRKAKEISRDDAGNAFDRAFKKIISPKKSKRTNKSQDPDTPLG